MKKNKSKILITGSSGTIGTRLFETLLASGYSVVGFDKKKNAWKPSVNRLTIVGDLLNKKDIKKIPTDVDMIIHLAANARVYDLVVEPNLALDNITTTYNVLEFARKYNIKKILFSSSREAYGNKRQITSKETDVDIQRCESPYAASKIADEVLIYSYAKCYGIDHVVCRFSNVYGMYDEFNRFVPLMIRGMQKNKNMEIFGKNKVLDFTYIDDCVAGIVACIDRFDKVKNTVFNIAMGKGTSLVQVANLIKKNLKSESRISLGNNRTGEVVKYVANISKAKKMLKYSPKTPIAEGIKKSISWYVQGH